MTVTLVVVSAARVPVEGAVVVVRQKRLDMASAEISVSKTERELVHGLYGHIGVLEAFHSFGDNSV